MFGHPLELIIVLVLALIFFGPEKLPEVAASAGKFVRELRAAFDAAANPEETNLPDDFSTYYYDSVSRSGEDDLHVEEMPDPADGAVDDAHSEEEWEPALQGAGSNPWDSHRVPPDTADVFDPDDLDPAAGPVAGDLYAEKDRPEAV
jgi:TatA/E family protein of Tat protein translocase